MKKVKGKGHLVEVMASMEMPFQEEYVCKLWELCVNWFIGSKQIKYLTKVCLWSKSQGCVVRKILTQWRHKVWKPYVKYLKAVAMVKLCLLKEG